MEMNLLLAKMFFKYDLELVNTELDWLNEGKVFVMWWKRELMVRFRQRAIRTSQLLSVRHCK
ncbi:hypothetical protein HYALB_00012520 [Hymenoscyphus albidus]|uniref:Uncharacterized protein n=1 Tax=Hymenoscyphus albidus TaxID=595503 RepID=A0A9N9LP51_9HELO|nr:hypothetical protein HYALB_00012520 [Hymenoscyphus albidus]